MFWSYQLMRGLSRQEMTQLQQREADEQLGRMAAAASRSTHQIHSGVRSVVRYGSGLTRMFRNEDGHYSRPRSNEVAS